MSAGKRGVARRLLGSAIGALPFALLLSLGSLAASGATAAPIATVYRYGAFVSVEPYAPNIVRVTIATEPDRANAPPGYGPIAKPDPSGWTHSDTAAGDDFASSALHVTVAAAASPKPPTQMERYFAPSLPPVAITIRGADGKPIVDMTGWEMAPHTVNGEKTFRVGASFSTDPNEHFYGLGQNQEGILDLRGRTIDCR